MDPSAALLTAVRACHDRARSRGSPAFLLCAPLGPASDVGGWLPLLDDHEQRRCMALRDPRHAHVYAASHALLRCVLAAVLDRGPQRIAYARDGRGKPRLADGCGVDFNLSHTRGMCLVGVRAQGRIGVDVEYVDPLHPLLARAARLRAPGEAPITPARQHVDAHARAVFASWVRKEALLKSDGRGLAQGSPRDLCLVRDAGGAWRDPREDAVVYDLGVSARHRAAVSLMPPARAPLLWRLPVAPG
ncbi:4'-phosphopantetheinyl transferase family protein [Bordetella genomosp. 13]|uniref:4'-phosphopantetheinyl transferase domain-containing protein n=1 Tax=Bordetella genomosp. 13 TaxID=463040 RepID=A0A1W6ZBE6_9BORD|nr:4'-phosphopantetheinyl transferase superfamily protein [Bordetella genomosp. 13]ARP94716.1 hypothetical protein CAL15_10155 [Bordetella genomosp. 13]